MQEQMACLLLITTSVALAGVVAAYAISISEQTFNPADNSQIGKIHDLGEQLLNQSENFYNQLPDNNNLTQTSPTP